MARVSSIVSRVVPGYVGDDGAVGAEQRVEQRRFAGVGRPDDRHAQALAHQLPQLAVAAQAFEPLAHRRETTVERAPVRLGHFVGKVDCGRELLEQPCQLGAQRAHLAGQAAAEVRQRGPHGGARLGVDDVGHGGRRVEVHLAVEERAPRELARLREPRAAGQERAHDLARTDGRTVDVQLEHLLAGVAARSGKRNREAPVDGVAALVHDGRVRRDARAQGRRRSH